MRDDLIHTAARHEITHPIFLPRPNLLRQNAVLPTNGGGGLHGLNALMRDSEHFFPVQGFRKFPFHGVLYKTNMEIDFYTIIQTRGNVTTGKYDTM
jgi:hypothetical protein